MFFSITGRGTVGTGRIERGIIKVGDEVDIIGMGEIKENYSNWCRDVSKVIR